MLVETLAALAGAGGTALVGAMATDAWTSARSGVARLFGRGGAAEQTAIEAQLDGNAALVAQADDPDEVRRSLVPVWRLQLEALLQQSWVQTNIARDHASLYQVQHGDLHVHQGQRA